MPHYKGRDKERDKDACRKYENAHGRLTPGLMLLFCPHGICVGLKIMDKCEGPSMLTDMLFTRLNSGPRMVVYDNACNTHRHCIKWQPGFFQNTRFCIDRIHKYNHHGCGPGYQLDQLDPRELLVDNVTVSALNSQVAEQCNSLLERIRTQVAYLKHENVMSYVKYFLAMRNKDKVVDLEKKGRGQQAMPVTV